MKSISRSLMFGFTLLGAGLAAAQDAYYSVPLNSLKGVDQFLQPGSNARGRSRNIFIGAKWHPVLDGAGEVYLNTDANPWQPISEVIESSSLLICAPKGAEVKGRVILTKPEVVTLEFTLSTNQAAPGAKDAFFEAKEKHYLGLQNENIPGAAWFRYQAMEAAKNHGATNEMLRAMRRLPGNPLSDSELEDTYDLFTGGRALSENLQLDRVLPATGTNEETVALNTVAGITVREMNWKELIKDAKPELDPLAAFIPADQHAIFFSSFQAMVDMIDEADANGTPVLQLLEPRSEDADSRSRYQKQLCLELNALSRLLGPQVINSVAFTGSDPYLRVGTDVAVLYEAKNVELLKSTLIARQKLAQSASPDAKAVSGEIAGVAFTGIVSADRSIGSYVASVSNVVFVSNSRIQLENLVRAANGSAAPLSRQDEYIYFRSRYPRTDKTESAFVILTDAAIRRWCGPKWRVADSRRTRAAAVMSDLQAAHLKELASGKVAEKAVTSGYVSPDTGETRLTRNGVVSSAYGSLNFMTPISELTFDKVTRAEADAYDRWRTSYQQNWRQYFDPIAIRFSLTRDRLRAELTVMPLIAGTDYREIMQIATGAAIAPAAGDPHSNTLLHVAMAINTQSEPVKEAGNFLGNMAPGLKANSFSWLGESAALYLDDDPFWDRLLQATNSESFFEHNFAELPAALHLEVKNPLGLTAFLTALHAFVDQSAPGMSTWHSLEYKNQPYVKVTAREVIEPGRDFAVYYAATPRSLVVTLSEPLLKRALDRQAAAGAGGKPSPAPGVNAWLGKSLAAAVEKKFVNVVQKIAEEDFQDHLQTLAWNNLPILNEWKRLYPDRDPVKFHEQFWGTKLLCPGGGTYVWNEKWRTMESTIFGHPGEPKTSATKALSSVTAARLGLTFENQGLSAQAVLNRKEQN